MPGKILLTGPGGFVGGHVLSAFTRRGAAHRLRLLVHRRPPAVPGSERAETRTGDLTRPDTLRGLCQGVHTVVHAASYVGADATTCDAVNHQGTAALVAEARRAGVSRVVYLSTAAVYGAGTHRGIAEDEVTPTPVSPASRSRLAAEGAVRGAGGTVVRAMFVLGAGDVWFLPTLLRATNGLSAWIEGGDARLSCIAVDDLARSLADLALRADLAPGGLYHCTYPEPTRVRDLVARAAERLGFPVPRDTLSLAAAIERLPAGVSERQARLFAEDHWYDSSLLWRTIGGRPATDPLDPGHAYWRWYAESIAPRPRLRTGARPA